MFATLACLSVFVYSSFATNDPGDPPSKTIRSLEVNADVTIVLVNNRKQALEMNGDAAFLDLVSVKESDGKLVVNSAKHRNLKSRGVIYVPASDLRLIRVNSAAHIRTANTLHVPTIRIQVNGKCRVQIATSGKVDFVENEMYEVEYQVLDLPSATAPMVMTSRE